MLSLEGRELGGCRLIRRIGAGGMGEVYLAEQTRVGNRLVAVKVVRPEDASFQPDVIADVERRFQREVALLGQFSHPNILPVYDSGVERPLLYLVMEYAPDGSLADAIRGSARHKLPLPAALPMAVDIITQLASALQYTHDRGVVHRDVKPGNVLVRIEPDGHWHMLLADFGVARGEETTTQTQVSGTFAYMAPEQFNGKFSPASDQYALAVMAFLLLTGRTPFSGDMGQMAQGHLYEQPPSVSALNPAIPEAVNEAIQRALAKDPTHRFPSVAAFASALRVAAGLEPAASGTASYASHALQEAVVNAETRPVAPPVAASAAAQQDDEMTAALAPGARPAQPPRRGLSPVRALIAALVAIALLAGIFEGTALINRGGGQPTPSASATNTPALAPSATATPNPALTFCQPGQTTAIGDDLTCAPPLPSGVSRSATIADPSPTCDTKYNWQATANAQTSCSTGVFTLASGTPNTLACVNVPAVSLADGYATVNVTPQSGAVYLSFREGGVNAQGTVTTTPPVNNGQYPLAGYFFGASASGGSGAYTSYQVFRIDGPNPTSPIASGLLPSPLAKDFALGALFKGGAITPSINGQALPVVNDATYTSGWFGVCTDGKASFSNAGLYPLAS